MCLQKHDSCRRVGDALQREQELALHVNTDRMKQLQFWLICSRTSALIVLCAQALKLFLDCCHQRALQLLAAAATCLAVLQQLNVCTGVQAVPGLLSPASW